MVITVLHTRIIIVKYLFRSTTLMTTPPWTQDTIERGKCCDVEKKFYFYLSLYSVHAFTNTEPKHELTMCLCMLTRGITWKIIRLLETGFGVDLRLIPFSVLCFFSIACLPSKRENNTQKLVLLSNKTKIRRCLLLWCGCLRMTWSIFFKNFALKL